MQIENLSRDAETFTANAYRLDGSVLIDTGSDPVIRDRVEELDTIVVTHSHPDHVGNLEQLVDRFQPTVYAYAPSRISVDAEPLEDGQELELAGHTFTVVHTPGHIADHVCLYNASKKVLFAGDLIFPGGSFGRTDLEEGDRDILIGSIRRITELDVDALYAGHDEPTTENVNQQIRNSLANAEKREPKY